MLGKIQSFRFFVVVDAQAHNSIHCFQDHETDDSGINRCCGNTDELNPYLTPYAGDPISEADSTQSLGTKDTR